MSLEIGYKLPEGVSLQLFLNTTVIFESSKKWLFPLFEVEDFLESGTFKVYDLFLHDKIAGRAAAFLITRMGFTRCHIDIVSKPAMEVFNKNHVNCSYTMLVDRISCKTEELITSAMEPDDVYRMLSKSAVRAG